MSDTLIARITAVHYSKPSKYSKAGVNFTIAGTDLGVTVCGEMSRPVVGQQYRFDGEHGFDKKYNRAQFKFERFEPIIDPSVGGMATFLSAHISGLGPVKAQAICEHFGDDTLRILRSNPASSLAVKGVTPAIRDAIGKYFEDNPEVDPAAYSALAELFADQKFPRKLIPALLKDFGSSAPDRVKANPYSLIAYPRMGWKNVDAFAVTRAGYDERGIERQMACVLEALQAVADDGHTYGSRVEIEAVCHGMLGFLPEPKAWVNLLRGREVVSHMISDMDGDLGPDEWLTNALDPYTEDDVAAVWLSAYFDDKATFALPRLDEAERAVAYHLSRIAEHARPLPCSIPAEGLNPDQARAVRMIETRGLCILAGAPGTGKSFTEAHVIGELAESVNGCRVVAPTGKAAKRSAELVQAAIIKKAGAVCTIDIPCTTIHRALGPTPAETPEGVPADSAKVGRGRDGMSFKHHEGNPLACRVLFIDEFSMVDTLLAASLLSAVPNGCRVVIVGDANQLPSVQAGAVLRDLMGSGIPVVELTRIVRSDGGGTVVRACHAVKDGRIPEASRTVELPTKNWVHLEMDDPELIAETIVGLHESAAANGNFDPVWDMQVISPQRSRGAISCGPLNLRLAELLNPPPEGRLIADEGDGPAFRAGDKVIRKKNGIADLMTPYDEESFAHKDWSWNGTGYSLSETDVVNGDMGTVLDIITGDTTVYVVVRFRNPDRLCRLAYGSCELQPAYAVTVHAAQGSGFPYVIVPVHLLFHWDYRKKTGLFCRELFYTAISRAERLCVTVGPWAAVVAVVGRQTLYQRKTKLVERVKALAAWPRGEIKKGVASVEVEV